MRKLSAILLALVPLSGQAQSFEERFEGRQMRLDYLHAGSATEERFYFDGLHEEPVWAGSRTSLVDESGFGSKLLKVFDEATGELVFSRSYCTLWDEWRLTAEAKSTARAMPESVTFPWPRAAARVEIWSRDPASGEFARGFEHTVDPADKFIRRFGQRYETFDVEPNKLHPAYTVDVVLLPEGYTEGEREKFEAAARQFVEDVFSFEPYKSLRGRFRVTAVWAPSAEGGVTNPGKNVWRHTSAGASFWTFDSERYQMTTDYRRLRDMVAHTPCDLIYVLSNSDKYGGGGIYNFYALSSAGERAPSRAAVYVHEFSHLLLGLGDEYIGGVSYDELSMYPPDREPWEVNLTTLTHFEDKAWSRMLPAGTAVPTPLTPGSAERLGVYEGGGYVSKGVYRPWPNCLMNSLHTISKFCPVCEAGIRDQIEFLCR